MENIFFQLSLNPSGAWSIIAGEAIDARTHIAPSLALRGRRGCSDAVIQWAAHPQPTSHPPPCTARSISVSVVLLRQTSRGGHSPKHRQTGSGLRELPRCIWRRKRVSPLFLTLRRAFFCKDERRLPRPGVHLPRGRIRGKMSSLLFIFFTANCGVKCCTAVVGLVARCGSPWKWLREETRSVALKRRDACNRVWCGDSHGRFLALSFFLQVWYQK